MTVKNVRMDIKELDTQLAKFKGLRVAIGRVIEEDLEEALRPYTIPLDHGSQGMGP